MSLECARAHDHVAAHHCEQSGGWLENAEDQEPLTRDATEMTVLFWILAVVGGSVTGVVGFVAERLPLPRLAQNIVAAFVAAMVALSCF
jgi:hypothetical protein